WILLSILSTLALENASAGKLQKTFLRLLHLLDVPPPENAHPKASPCQGEVPNEVRRRGYSPQEGKNHQKLNW
ncbi:MAG: hypothetical protein SO081_04320, partial [Oscillospiraceae bacterium]|nr:hypothetical protein [Oscillospiraceae bacterium]